MRPARLAALALALLACLSWSVVARSDARSGEPVAVTAEPLTLAPFSPSRTRFGALRWLGGLRLQSEDPRFGGFSGLVLSGDGGRLVAVSDRGWWLSAGIEREDGRPRGLRGARMASILGPDGQRSRSHTRRDAEALSVWDARGIDGPLLVAFEQRARIERFDIPGSGFAARPEPVAMPREIARGPNNREIEALGRFVEGPRQDWLLAISEGNFDPEGNIRAWIWRDGETEAFAVARHSDYLVTDLAILPGGRQFVTVERSFSLPLPPGMAIRLFDVDALAPGALLVGKVLFEGRRPLYSIDNMEAIAVHRSGDGAIVLTLMSDDNYFRAIQSTILIEFALEP